MTGRILNLAEKAATAATLISLALIALIERVDLPAVSMARDGIGTSDKGHVGRASAKTVD
jgi:hypothetical protein